MTRFIIVTALFFAALAAVGIFAISARSTERIAEDSPSWNCHTMGNGVCGPIQDDPRFKLFDSAFNCFAENTYTHLRMPWNDRVMRCIPPVSP